MQFAEKKETKTRQTLIRFFLRILTREVAQTRLSCQKRTSCNPISTLDSKTNQTVIKQRVLIIWWVGTSAWVSAAVAIKLSGRSRKWKKSTYHQSSSASFRTSVAAHWTICRQTNSWSVKLRGLRAVGVENRNLPFTWPMAYTTASVALQDVIMKLFYQQ